MNPKDLVGAKKAALGVVPPALLIGTAPAMAVGANKYGPFNWRAQPVQMMTYVEAVMRHMLAFMDGQDNAEDTGVSHLAHAAASLGILMDAIAMANVIDNRPSAGAAPILLRAQDKSASPAPTAEGLPGCPACIDDATITEEAHTNLIDGAQARRTERNLARLAQAANGGIPVYATFEHRGEYPPDVRVGGYLRCCGAMEHTIDCPQYR